jgi:hypothetical protein
MSEGKPEIRYEVFITCWMVQRILHLKTGNGYICLSGGTMFWRGKSKYSEENHYSH